MGIGGEATNIARGPKRQEADFGTVEKVQKKKKKSGNGGDATIARGTKLQ